MAGARSADGQDRLMIKMITCENFKSYAGEKEIGPFHKCFTAVVGPNGSGKSNVIDSLLFVFAKGAKALRHKKAADLIHNSAEHPDCGFCKVQVHFQNITDTGDGDEDYEVVEGSQFVVSRHVTKAGASTYKINSTVKTMSEVTEELRTRGIDLNNNRFLILQGEVESIAMMDPKGTPNGAPGLLEFLEELIGSNRHVVAIAAAESQHEEQMEARKSKLERVKMTERQKDDVEGSMVEAKELLSKRVELAQGQARLSELYAAQSVKCAEGGAAVLEETAERLAGAKAQLAAVHEEGEGVKEELAAFQATFAEKKAAVDAEDAKWSEFEQKDIKYREELKHSKDMCKKMEKAAQREAKKADQCDKAEAEAELAQPRLQSELARHEEDAAEQAAKLETLDADCRGETEELRVRLVAKQRELEPSNETMAASKGAEETANAEAELILSESEAAKKQLAKFEATLEKDRAERPRQHARVTELAAEHAAAAARLPEAEAELDEAEPLEAPLKARRDEAQRKLEGANAAQGASRSSGRMIDALKKATRKGGELEGAGFLGRLGDLGTIGEQFDVAITMSAGGALNQLVCEDARGAKLCVAWLKRNNAGCATFVMLDKLEYLKQRMDAPVQPAPPAGTRRLFDLITPKEERFRTAFYKAVRNTLVARNLDEASAIAYKGKRAVHQVVTLQGEIISTSGTMAGGGAKARSGGMKAQLAAEPMDAAEHKALERGLADANAEISALRARISGLKKEVTALRRSLPKLETAKRSLEMELSSADERMAALEAQLDSLREAAVLPEAAQQRVDELREAAEGHAAEYTAAEAAAKSIREEANALQKKIKDVGGPRLRRQTQKVEELNEKVAETARAYAKAGVDAKNEHKNAAKARAAGEKAMEEAKALAAQRAQLKQDFAAVEDEAAACHERLQAAKAALEGEKTNTKQFHAKHEKLQKKVQQAEDVMGEVQQEYDGEAQEHKKNQEKIKYWDAQFKSARETYAKEVQEYAVCEGLDDDDEDDAGAEQETAAAVEEGEEQAAAPKRKGGRFAATLEPLADAELGKKIADEAALGKAVGDAKHQISLLEQECTVIEGTVDMTSIIEFKKKEKEYLGNVRELDVATRAVHDSREKLEDVKKRRLEEFHAGFSQISNKLKEMYQMITLGGDAELELVDSLDPFSGIVFSVRPHRKSWKPISMLSGGEKTLASLALVFALHHCYPTPLYVMDEIDAALDFRNVSIVGNYIKERTRNAQVSARAARPAHPQRAPRTPRAPAARPSTDPRSARRSLAPSVAPSRSLARSSSSFRCATTCSSWQTGWLASTRRTTQPRA